jgi:hypothetical protein
MVNTMGLYTCLDDPYIVGFDDSSYGYWDYTQDFIEDALREEHENQLTRRLMLLTNTLWNLYV